MHRKFLFNWGIVRSKKREGKTRKAIMCRNKATRFSSSSAAVSSPLLALSSSPAYTPCLALPQLHKGKSFLANCWQNYSYLLFSVAHVSLLCLHEKCTKMEKSKNFTFSLCRKIESGKLIEKFNFFWIGSYLN